MGYGFLLFSLSRRFGVVRTLQLISLILDDKNHEKILDNSRLEHVSLSARISLIAILVMEIRKSQGDASVLFGIRNSFSCALFLTF